MKIYLLGDSFTDNLFKYEIEAIKDNRNRHGQTYQYVKLLKNQNLPYPLHFEDYLRLWGHEVINLGVGGCSNDSIFHQFTQIKEPFDRLIINWTGLSRFDWYHSGNGFRTFTGGMPPNYKLSLIDELLIEQGHNRLENKAFRDRTIDFISFLVSKYAKQKQIIWAPLDNICKVIENIKGYVWYIQNPIFKNIIPEFNKLEIFTETNQKINDMHYGRYGNFYTALMFNTILEHTKDIEHDGFYINDLDLFLKIKENILTAQHNIIEINHSI